MSGLDGLGWPNPEDEPKPKTMKPTLKEILEAALDALWELHGNGYGTEQEQLIAELQMEIPRHNATAQTPPIYNQTNDQNTNEL